MYASDITSDSDTANNRIGLKLFILIATYLLLTGWNFNIQTVANPDEPRYAAAARTMLREGDWLLPKFNAQPRTVKPIFFYWLIAATAKAAMALGASMTAGFRLGPALMGLIATLATFFLGRRLLGARAGFLAGVIVMTSGEFHKLTRLLVVDMTLTAFIACALLCFHIALERMVQSPKSKVQSPFLPLLGFYFSMGMACMTKGPAPVGVFVVVPVVALLWWTGRLALFKRAGLFWGVPLSLLIGHWWFIALWSAGHKEEVKAFFYTENFQRVAGAKDHTSHPWPYGFYFQSLSENFMPWFVLLPFAGYWSYRAALATGLRGLSEPAKFLVCCLALPFLLVGLSISKRPLYLLPLYPYIALWLALACKQTLLRNEGAPVNRKAVVALAALAALVLLGSLGVALYLPRFGGQGSEAVMLAVIGSAVALSGILAARDMRRGLRYKAGLQIAAMAMGIAIGYEAVVTPIRERNDDRVNFFKTVAGIAAGRRVVVLGESANEAVWYLDRRERVEDLQRPEMKPEFFDAKETVMLVNEKELADPELKQSLLLGPEIKRGSRSFYMALPDPSHPPDPALFVARSGRHAAAPAAGD